MNYLHARNHGGYIPFGPNGARRSLWSIHNAQIEEPSLDGIRKAVVSVNRLWETTFSIPDAGLISIVLKQRPDLLRTLAGKPFILVFQPGDINLFKDILYCSFASSVQIITAYLASALPVVISVNSNGKLDSIDLTMSGFRRDLPILVQAIERT